VPKDDPQPPRDESKTVAGSDGLEERRHVISEYIRSLREFLKALRDKLN
jgi:hypothetical protein